MQAERQVSDYPLHETGGFSDLIEAHGDPRCDIALGTHGLCGQQIAVRITRQVATQIKPLAARTAGESSEA